MFLTTESKTQIVRAIRRAGKTLLVLAAVGVSNVYADDPPGGGDYGGDGGTNGVGSTDFIAQPFPLNLITTCLSAEPAGSLSSLSDLDGAVAAGFGQMTNDLMILYPPGIYSIPVDGGLFTFPANSDIAANIDLFQPFSFKGFSLWKMGAVETQLTTRSWVYMGASDGTNSVAFRTHPAPSGFDAQAWVRSMCGNPPTFFSDDDLPQWYAERDRSRAFLGLTLIRDTDLPALQAVMFAAQANATNAIPDPSLPTLPADTNRVAFAGLAGFSADGRLGVWIYSPVNNLPVDVLTRPALTANMPWQLTGTLNAHSPFTLWYAPPGTSASAFFTAARADIDSDGDGIPDDREILVFGTNPYAWDSAGTSLGDYARSLIYGLSATNRNANGDGMDDDEAILRGMNPVTQNANTGASTVRYLYDQDDRLTGAFTTTSGGTGGGAAVFTVSPAHNTMSASERGAP